MQLKGTSKIRKASYFLSVAAILSAVLSYISTVSMGFPDGHLTEFELALKPLFTGHSILALFLGILFYGSARSSSKSYFKVVFYSSLALFIILVIGLVLLHFYFRSNLDHGHGG